MIKLLEFHNVSLFAKEEFGLSKVSFLLEKKKRYHFILPAHDQLEALLGILEGRYRPDRGVVEHHGKFFSQSDRLLFGDKVFSQKVNNWWGLNDPFFQFENRRQSKETFLDFLKARHLRHFPIYSLRGEEKLKFILLSMLFQENGLILISRFHFQTLSEKMANLFERIIKASTCTLCFFSLEGTSPIISPGKILPHSCQQIVLPNKQ